MNCPKCGTSLPDGAKFCSACGSPTGVDAAPASPPKPAAPTIAPAGVQDLKCPSCGAPIKPVFGEMVVSCDYCGGTVTLGSGGWSQINKHTMLTAKITDGEAALKLIHDYLDTGFMHRKAFEESKIVEQKLSFVPFWVVPVSASTNFQYQDVATSVGSTVGTMVAAEMIGSALGGGRRGGFMPVPIMMGPAVGSNRQDSISGMYEYPVIAVKGMTSYQPHNYQFQLAERSFFDKKQIPSGAAVLNGDLGEDAAKFAARAYVTQLQSEAAHQKHHMVSKLQSQVDVSDAELLHVPIWYVLLDRKGQKTGILIDAHAAHVMQVVG